MKIRPEGKKLIWGSFWLGVLLGLFKLHLLMTLFFAFSLLFMFFFRDPERDVVFSPEFVLSPADGVIRELERLPNGIKISIFMSIFDCHVNRSPHSGTVKEIRPEGGGFKPAFLGGSSSNAKNSILIDTVHGIMRIDQIAGLLARRIACWVKPGQRIEAGERIGMIYLGSRVDLFIPGDWELFVRKGMRVKAGETILGKKA